MSGSEYPRDGSARSAPTTRLKSGGLEQQANPRARVGTIVWGLIVLALAALIIVARLGLVVLNGSYVLIGLMLGAGAALVVGGLISARGRDKKSSTGKS
jgi:membrane-associated phospholipid phosphatase